MDRRATFGDYVRCYIPGHGTPASEHYVIGEPVYSVEGRVVMLADECAVGMPVAVQHCTPLSSGHVATCEALHRRYAELFPAAIKPIECSAT